MRDNWLSNRGFTTYADILDHCCNAWRSLIDQPWRIMSHRPAHVGASVMINEGWYQALDARTLAGLEALVRWQHPRLGQIAPPDLIAAATSVGLTESLLRTILEQVCVMMQILCSRGVGTVRVAMNVSPREMAQVPVDELVIERLSTLGV